MADIPPQQLHDCRPQSQALSVDFYAVQGFLAYRSLVGVGKGLRQLALLGLKHVPGSTVVVGLEQLPMLQVNARDNVRSLA